jgi:hypothetical protein
MANAGTGKMEFTNHFFNDALATASSSVASIAIYNQKKIYTIGSSPPTRTRPTTNIVFIPKKCPKVSGSAYNASKSQ